MRQPHSHLDTMPGLSYIHKHTHSRSHKHTHVNPTSGSAPNRIFNIEWRAIHMLGQGPPVNFEVRLYEGSPSRLDFVYGVADSDGAAATSGVQKDSTYYSQYSCYNSSLPQGLLIS